MKHQPNKPVLSERVIYFALALLGLIVFLLMKFFK